MATATRGRLYAGPFKGVFASPDPYDASPDFLVDAMNGYVPDPTNKSGWNALPGWRLLNGGEPLVVSASAFRGQCVYTHIELDGSSINFLVMAGKVFRVDATLSTFTDVTPVGVTIDSAVTTRAFFLSLAGTLMASDGVNRPWIATNLTATPITGTYIDYDGAGVSWAIRGAPRVYGGAGFGALIHVNGVSRGQDISWCVPGNFALGWQQAIYDNNWTLIQNEGGIIYALESDNLGLRYFRESSIGAVSGVVGPDLASTATDDALAFNIGAQASQTIQKFGNGYFFLDAQGRPYFAQPGSPPEAIWEQMRTFVAEGTANYQTTTAIVATGIIEPTLNLYVVAIWSPRPSTQEAPFEAHIFDAKTRIYQGRLRIGPRDGPWEGLECIGTLLDSAGRATMIALTTGGYVWAFSALASTPEQLATEDGVLLTTEDGIFLTTEGQRAIWMDNDEVPLIYAKTDKFGYDENVNLNVDLATIVTLSVGPVEVSCQTSAVAQTVEGTPSPSTSQDGTSRLVCGFDIMGRGPAVTVSPTTADEQFVLQRVSIKAQPSLAGPEDP